MNIELKLKSIQTFLLDIISQWLSFMIYKIVFYFQVSLIISVL